MGCELFRRSSRGVALTEEGELLFSHVKVAFETLELGEDRLKNSLELGVGHLRIGVSTTLCKYMLLPYLNDFIKEFPHINISISCQSTHDTMLLLEDNKIDIGFIGKPDNLKGMTFFSVDEIEDIFVATNDYLKNLKMRGVDKKDILQNATLMLLDKNNITRQYINGYLQDNHIIVQNSIDVSSMDLLIDFAKISVGVACVIRKFVEKELEEGSLIQIPVGFSIHKREVGFSYKHNAKPTKSLECFIDFFKHHSYN